MKALVILGLFAGLTFGQQDPNEAQRRELAETVQEANTSSMDMITALEGFLRKYPATTLKLDIYKFLAKAAIDVKDDVRIVRYGVPVIDAAPAMDINLLDRTTAALIRQGGKENATRGLDYAKRIESYVSNIAVPEGADAAKNQEDHDRIVARVLLYQSRANSILGDYDEARKKAALAFIAYPEAQSARIWSNALEHLGRHQEAIERRADAFSIPDIRATVEDRAEDRRVLAEWYKALHGGAETGLGDELLAAYDRTSKAVEKELSLLRKLDPNLSVSDPMKYTLAGLTGGKLELSSLRGKVVIFDFWATWCVPCRAQHPLYEQVKQRFLGRTDVVFLSVDTDEDHSVVPGFLSQQQWSTNVYFDSGMVKLLAIDSIPSTMIADKKGRLVSRMDGYREDSFVDQLTARIKTALENIPPIDNINMAFNRIIWIVLDSVGIGEMPDADKYGDKGSDTLGNIARQRQLHLPNLSRLGLANIKPLTGLPPVAEPIGAYGKCALASPGKDTTTGHWEMAGIHLDKPLPLFPHGFPREIMQPFEAKIGRKTLGNKAASGTEIIDELGAEHMRTGSPIVYTSADSVFQVAAHEEVIPLFELYKICETARELLRGPYEVGRVIARPFIGSPGAFTRTANRHDYAVAPPKGMLLDQLKAKGVEVMSVGKIFDVFLGRGIGDHEKTKTNADGMAKTLAAMEDYKNGLIFVNLVDFDMLFGHRNNVEGYAKALEEVDQWLPALETKLAANDLVILTADHGCDPTTPSTDHSREYVPVLAFGPHARHNVNLGTRATLSDIGQTIAENFGTSIVVGKSFLADISA